MRNFEPITANRVDQAISEAMMNNDITANNVNGLIKTTQANLFVKQVNEIKVLALNSLDLENYPEADFNNEKLTPKKVHEAINFIVDNLVITASRILNNKIAMTYFEDINN